MERSFGAHRANDRVLWHERLGYLLGLRSRRLAGEGSVFRHLETKGPPTEGSHGAIP
jgi:hypothetical protein